jgi:hypothetical protein
MAVFPRAASGRRTGRSDSSAVSALGERPGSSEHPLQCPCAFPLVDSGSGNPDSLTPSPGRSSASCSGCSGNRHRTRYRHVGSSGGRCDTDGRGHATMLADNPVISMSVTLQLSGQRRAPTLHPVNKVFATLAETLQLPRIPAQTRSSGPSRRRSLPHRPSTASMEMLRTEGIRPFGLDRVFDTLLTGSCPSLWVWNNLRVRLPIG